MEVLKIKPNLSTDLYRNNSRQSSKKALPINNANDKKSFSQVLDLAMKKNAMHKH